MTKIIGIRQAVRDIMDCPRDHHVEIWSQMSGDDIEVWASEWLSQNTWTTNHPETERELTGTISEIRSRAEDGGRRISNTDAIKQAAEEVWGVKISSPSQASAPKRIRKSGGSLVVAVSDLAEAIDAGEGDTVEVSIRRME